MLPFMLSFAPMIYDTVELKNQGISGAALGWVALIGGFGILLVVYLLARRRPG